MWISEAGSVDSPRPFRKRRETRNAPVRSVAIVACQRSAVISRNGTPAMLTPAELTTTDAGPNAVSTAANAASTDDQPRPPIPPASSPRPPPVPPGPARRLEGNEALGTVKPGAPQ